MTTQQEAYPLSWPAGWPRCLEPEPSRFSTPQGRAQQNLMREIELLGGTDAVISTNIPLRRDGLPMSARRAPDDQGVAVYFLLKGRQMVFACDRFTKLADNVHAIGKTIEALRGIERWGASQMMERAFSGFTALPPATAAPTVRAWWEVLEVDRSASLDVCRQARNRLARKYHPDVCDKFQRHPFAKITEVNEAFAECQKEKT